MATIQRKKNEREKEREEGREKSQITSVRKDMEKLKIRIVVYLGWIIKWYHHS
jgi:hypothetical protein